MSKPICKAEAKWDVWRDDRGFSEFRAWQENYMARSRRRFSKKMAYLEIQRQAWIRHGNEIMASHDQDDVWYEEHYGMTPL